MVHDLKVLTSFPHVATVPHMHLFIFWCLRICELHLHQHCESQHPLKSGTCASAALCLQDSTRFDKTQKLLEKYDPEYVPSSPNRGHSNSTHFAAASTPGLRHRNISQVQGQSNTGMMSPLAGLQRGMGAAGSRVGPMLSSLAGMVGDNPALMDGLK